MERSSRLLSSSALDFGLSSRRVGGLISILDLDYGDFGCRGKPARCAPDQGQLKLIGHIGSGADVFANLRRWLPGSGGHHLGPSLNARCEEEPVHAKGDPRIFGWCISS